MIFVDEATKGHGGLNASGDSNKNKLSKELLLSLENNISEEFMPEVEDSISSDDLENSENEVVHLNNNYNEGESQQTLRRSERNKNKPKKNYGEQNLQKPPVPDQCLVMMSINQENKGVTKSSSVPRVYCEGGRKTKSKKPLNFKNNNNSAFKNH